MRAARRAARAGARLHNRVVALFSLVAAIPALVTALVATVSVEWVINPAFMNDVASFLAESGALSQVYSETQCQALLREAELTAGDLSQAARLVRSDPNLFQGFLNARRAGARLLRRRRHQVRRHGDRAGGGRRPQADRQARPGRFRRRRGQAAVLRPAARRPGLRRHTADRRDRRRLFLRRAGHRPDVGQGRARRFAGLGGLLPTSSRIATTSSSVSPRCSSCCR